MAQLWKGRFKKELAKETNDFNSSIKFDSRMFEEDIKGSIAHATMLGATGIIEKSESDKIVNGLNGILDDIKSGKLEIDMSAEDIHTFVEGELTARLGQTGKRLHTARSRNDQVALDIRMVLKKEIDEINILRASFLAMHRAVDQLTTRPQHLLIDGNRFTKYPDIPHTTVVKGDGKYLTIAAASILAKTYRDDYMNRLHEEYPYYDWNRNKGYPTKKHRAAIAEHGTTPYHRMTFNLLGGEQLSLDF